MKRYLILLSVLFFVSCKSYDITSSSLKNQLEQTESILDNNPENYVEYSYSGKSLSSLKVKNSKDEEVVLNTENSIVLKVTRKDGFKFKYYLNSMSVNGNTFRGMGPTYLVGGMIHKVHLDSIASIKVKP